MEDPDFGASRLGLFSRVLHVAVRYASMRSSKEKKSKPPVHDEIVKSNLLLILGKEHAMH